MKKLRLFIALAPHRWHFVLSMKRKHLKFSLATIGAVLLLFLLWRPIQSLGDADLGFGYVERGGHIHFLGGGRTGGLLNSTRIDKPSKANAVGFRSALSRPLTLCDSPDVPTFEALSEEYTRDKNRVYYKWVSPGRFLVVELPQADAASFKPLNFAHAVDKNVIWYLDQPIPDSLPEHAILISNRIVKDTKHVYASGKPQAHLDAESFHAIGSDYYKDVNTVYWGTEEVKGADSASFKVLGDSFVAVDKISVYRSGQSLPGIDPASCKFILDDPYGYQVISDKNGVYLNGLKFLHADPANFAMIDARTGHGGKYVFLIDTYHSTPVTLYREKGSLLCETILYDRKTDKALSTIKAEVGKDLLENITLSPVPGAPPLPDWQVDLFKREDLVRQMNKAGKHLIVSP